MNYFNSFSKYKQRLLSLVLIILTLIIANSLLLKDVIYESDDYQLHAVRSASYYLALKQGQLPVRWGPNLNGGYGYPAFNYMYHTPYFLSAFIHSFGFSIQESVNLSVLFSLLLGAIGCYFFVYSYIKSEIWGTVLALYYILNPYTLLNIYWRGAIGELFFYAFVPFFFLGVKKILNEDEKPLLFIYTSCITAILVFSHLPSLFLLYILLLFFVISNQSKLLQWKNLTLLFYTQIVGLLLSAWYWIPAYFEQWMIIYQDTASLDKYSTQFVPLFSLLDIGRTIHQDTFFLQVLQIGGISILSLLLGIFVLKFSKKARYWIILFCFSLFLITPHSQFIWDKLVLLQYIQYPWRLISLITFASIMILICFATEKNVNQRWKQIIAFALLLYTLLHTQTYILNKGTTKRTDFDWYHPTFETGSSFNEHLPRWAKTAYFFPDELLYVNASQSALLAPDNLEKYVHKLSELNSVVTVLNGTSISYQVTPNQDIFVLHKRLSFPGWDVQINDESSEFMIDIPTYQGILAVRVPQGMNTVTVAFTGYTKLRKYAEFISFFSFIFFIGQFLFKKYRIK